MARILIIEDQADIRRLIRWTLEPDAHEIVESSNGKTGLELALARHPDIVLVDAMMPGELDGYDVCRSIKGHPALRAVPVIMVSAKASERDRQIAADAGADEFMAKPFSPIALVTLVDRLLLAASQAQRAAAPGQGEKASELAT